MHAFFHSEFFNYYIALVTGVSLTTLKIHCTVVKTYSANLLYFIVKKILSEILNFNCVLCTRLEG